MDTVRSSRRRSSRSVGAFTLVELLTVIAILAVLLAMLLPALDRAMEHSRTYRCQHNLQELGTAYVSYSHDNLGYLPAYSQVDERLLDYYHNNNPGYEYAAGYDYHNVLAPYLGFGNCMPGTPNWSNANRSQFEVYRCPGARGVTSPYSLAVKEYCWPEMPDNWIVQSFYMQNASWTALNQPGAAQNYHVPGCSWPMMHMSCNLFQQPDKAIVLHEHWACNGMAPDGCTATVPYSTHFKVTALGAVGVGRSILYADWHVTFLPTGDWPVKYDDTTFGYKRDVHGNDQGYKYIDQWFGEEWEAWYTRTELLMQS